jgi:hypothetical protein
MTTYGDTAGPDCKRMIIIFLHGLGRLTCFGVDALPSSPRASTVSSSSRLVVDGVFRKSGVVHSFKMVDPLLFVFGSHVLYSRDLQFFSSLPILFSLVYPLTLLRKRISAASRRVMSRVVVAHVSKASSPHSAIYSFLLQIRVSSPFLKVIQ